MLKSLLIWISIIPPTRRSWRTSEVKFVIYIAVSGHSDFIVIQVFLHLNKYGFLNQERPNMDDFEQ